MFWPLMPCGAAVAGAVAGAGASVTGPPACGAAGLSCAKAPPPQASASDTPAMQRARPVAFGIVVLPLRPRLQRLLPAAALAGLPALHLVRHARALEGGRVVAAV